MPGNVPGLASRSVRQARARSRSDSHSAARQRFELDAADAELAVAAGLLFVFAFGVRFAANRFAIWNLGRLQRQLDVIALAQLGDYHFDVLLARTRKQKFLRLRIAAETQRRIFLENSVDRRSDLVFVRTRLRLDRKSNQRLGQARRRIKN